MNSLAAICGLAVKQPPVLIKTQPLKIVVNLNQKKGNEYKPFFQTHLKFSSRPPSRPVSAILTPKKLLFYQKELMQDESRPGSASSFQMMRTEAWRSSASSASTGFPTSATNAAKFTQFVVNDQLNRTPKGSAAKRSMTLFRLISYHN